MFYSVSIHSEHRTAVVSKGAHTIEGAHRAGRKARPSDWSGLDYTEVVEQAPNRETVVADQANLWTVL